MNNNIKIKICGLRYGQNIDEMLALSPNYVGFIFYRKSKRFVGDSFNPQITDAIPEGVGKIGVFVNATAEEVIQQCDTYQLDYVQLHGDETPEYCQALKAKDLALIKAFRVDDEFDFNVLTPYKPYCSYFLFDTKGKNYGGNGIQFNWDILQNYDNELPLFLSGGIGEHDVEKIRALKGLNLHAIDVNSKFEILPAIKNMEMLTPFINKLRVD